MQPNFFLVLVVHIFVYSIVFLSIFDLYFTTPIVDGVKSVDNSVNPPASRLVLIVSDGLRADKFFEIDGSGTSRAPYLRERMLRDAVWGVAHSQPPTESRPAHVAILGGFFEDVSAIKVLWKRNPVEFDTVLNRSKETWAWGAPDVLPFFNQGSAASHVHIYCHNYNQHPLYQLDQWVFTEVEKFFQVAKSDEDLRKRLHNEKNIFFLHLAGIDSNGHQFDSISQPYLQNIPIIDKGIQKMVDVFEDFYKNDNKTAFIFTADHGQTDRGSHGGGTPAETLVPVVAWGAGVGNPEQDGFQVEIKPLNDIDLAQTKKWGLDPNKRVDISQVDLAVIMSSLISVPIPINSMGYLPLPYLSGDLSTKAEISRIHAMQMMEQLIAKYRQVEKRSFHLLSSLLGRLDEFALWQRSMEIYNFIKRGEYHVALQKSDELFQDSKRQLLYYHNCQRPFIYSSVFLSLSGCLLLAFTFIKKDNSAYKTNLFVEQASKFKLFPNSIKYFAGVSTLLVIILYYYKSPWMEYAYYFSPVIVWYTVTLFSHILIPQLRHLCRNRTFWRNFWKIAPASFFWIWVVMMCLFNRKFVAIGLLYLSALPYFITGRKCITQNIIWTCLCIIMAAFPLLPEVIRKDMKKRKELVVLSGILGTVLVLCWNCVFRKERQKQSATKLKLLKRYLGNLRVIFPAVSGVVVYFTTSNVILKDSGKYFLWISCVAPVLASRNVVRRLATIVLFQITAYILFSLTYDALFCINLVALLLVWLKMEIVVGNANNQTTAAWRDSKFEWNSKQRSKPFTLRAMGNTLIFVFFLIVGFFGLFSIEAANDFNIRKLPFLPISDPTLLIATLAYKLSVHYIFIACTFYGVLMISHVRIHDVFCMLMLLTDIMLMHMIFWVKDTGSWAEIGISVTRFAIIVVLPFATCILMLICKVYTSLNLFHFLSFPFK